jgi:outer membrane protein insertion porin family
LKQLVCLVEARSEPSTSAGFFCSRHSHAHLTGRHAQVRVRRSRGSFGWLCVHLLFLCIILLDPIASAKAQTASQDQTPYEVKEIEFEGNETLSDKTLLSVMTTKESPGSISSFLYDHVSERLGSKREYFNPAGFDVDLGNLKALYNDNGFFSAQIDTAFTYDETERSVIVKVVIREGYRSLVDSIRYVGLDSISPPVREEISSGAKIKTGSPFSAEDLTQEQERVISLLYNQGYPEAKLDSTIVRRRLSTNNVDIVLTFRPGREFRVGKITIAPEGATADEIDSSLVFHHLDLSTGQVYSLKRKLSTERNLSRSGVFETVRVEARFPPPGDTSRSVPVTIFLKPRDKHELTPELFVDDADNAFNLGMGLGYNNRNFFGNARNLSARGTIRLQSIQRISVLRMFTASGFRQPPLVASAELSVQLLQPYIFSNSVSGSWTFSLIADKKKPYLQSIARNKIGIADQLSDHSFAFFDWSIERMSVEIFDTSSAALFTGEQRPQLNSILVATLQRDMTNDIISPSKGLFTSFSLEEGGVLPALFRNFGSNLPFSQYYKVSAYARWYKDLSKSRFTILAMKLKGGFAQPFRFDRDPADENLPVPLNRRFFAGGSGSVRGWRTRELGAFDQPQFGGDATLEGSVETRINVLKNVGDFWWLKLSGVWAVLFVDFGNVWDRLQDIRFHQVAIASGFGIRYDTIFGPIRVDLGFKAYDPSQPEGKQWFTSKRFWGEALGNGVLHFGIGQAF